MGFEDLSQTQEGLVSGLAGKHGRDESSWERFFTKYGPAIRGFCIYVYRMQPAEADEITQQVLVKLHKSLQQDTFDPSRSLRKWLKAVTRNAIIDAMRARHHRPDTPPGGSDNQGYLESLPQSDMTDRLASQVTTDLYRDLYVQAESMVKASVNERYWSAYQMLRAGLSPAEVAEQLDMSADNVYQANRRVKMAFRSVADQILKTVHPDDSE